jgi:hypothetical protein
MTIPTKNNNVRLDLLHPKMISRLEHFFADARIAGKVTVISGCRSYATQMRFYRKYLTGRGNLAANPDRRFGPRGPDGLGIWRGSWHMQQLDGYCHAVDFALIGRGNISKPEVNRIATSFGIVPTIVDREWWHHQWRSAAAEEFPAPAIDGARSEREKISSMDWAGIATALAIQKMSVRVNPLRMRSSGPAVKTVQLRLGEIGFDSGKPDGIFGRRTFSAVRRYQRATKVLTADGIVGSKTWDAMWQPDGDISDLYS